MESVKSFADRLKQMNITPVAEEEVEKREKLEREERKQKNFESSGVGKRYWNYSLDDYVVTDDNRECFEAVKEYIAEGGRKNMWLVGATGTGKTMLGAMIVKELGGTYAKAYQMVNDAVKAQSFSSVVSLNQLIINWSNIKILVIDEVGKGFNKDMELNILWQLLNERYERGVGTVLISNLSKLELASYLGSHLTDRFADGCRALEFKGKSMRGIA